jgi:hypothetical protein
MRLKIIGDPDCIHPDSVYTKCVCLMGIDILHGDYGDSNDPPSLYHHQEMGLKALGRFKG